MGDIDTFQLRAAFVQAQAQIMNGGTYEPVVLISKPLALSLLDEIERLRRWKAEASTVLTEWDWLAEQLVHELDFDETIGRRKSDIVAEEVARLRALAGQLATSSHWWEEAAVGLAVELLSFPDDDIDDDALDVAHEVLQRAHDDGDEEE